MVGKDGRVKVLDFGLAKVSDSGDEVQAASELPTAMKTREGIVMGTAPYMSQEQVGGQDVDQRTDLFSLGVMLFEMAIIDAPFARVPCPGYGGVMVARMVVASRLSSHDHGPRFTLSRPEVLP